MIFKIDILKFFNLNKMNFDFESNFKNDKSFELKFNFE